MSAMDELFGAARQVREAGEQDAAAVRGLTERDNEARRVSEERVRAFISAMAKKDTIPLFVPEVSVVDSFDPEQRRRTIVGHNHLADGWVVRERVDTYDVKEPGIFVGRDGVVRECGDVQHEPPRNTPAFTDGDYVLAASQSQQIQGQPYENHVPQSRFGQHDGAQILGGALVRYEVA